ncbi:helix-turn-helix domain-containing transcriptional regulator [Geminicoccus flavidas]|uniref:helix-turn-helix domain-containing transcriptional regulator n=1 Tax=Geminicoccus flavidas TaxID=2506407 RepID=UPI0013567C1E|nr:hypothetical protein [Geminicoccus flavidas]
MADRQRQSGMMERVMERVKLKPFDAAAYLDTPEDAQAFLEDAFEHGSVAEIVHAMMIVGRSSLVAGHTPAAGPGGDRSREAGAAGPLSFADALEILKAAGLRLAVVRPGPTLTS